MSQFQENSYSKTAISFRDKCYSDACLTKTANKGTEVIVLEYEGLLCNCSSINFKGTRKKFKLKNLD